MTRTHLGTFGLLMIVAMPGCKGRNQPAGGSSCASGNPPSSAAAMQATNNVTDKWLGQWTGPEGTYLRLSKNAGEYVVVINSLDGQATYEGTSNGGRIEFRRNGNTESIHAGNGHDTGMKWLLDKTNCLIIKAGEAFCRG